MNDIVSTNKLRDDQDDFVNAIIESKGANLPATIDEIIPILAFSKAKADAFMALSDAAGKVKEQEELNQAALASGQRWGIVHLYGQKRLGEITREMPTAQGVNEPKRLGGVSAEPKQAVLRTQGVTHQAASDAERIAAHPEIMEKVIEDAKERGDIPTKGAVLSRIKAESYKERLDNIPKEKEDIDDVARTIMNRLADDYVKLMKMWPYREQISSMVVDGIVNAIDDLYTLVTEESDE